MNITPETRIADIAAQNPATIRIFQQLGIDFCCGGKRPLAEACRERQITFAELTSALASAETGSPAEIPGEDAGLAELERALHEHIHLENNVVFPRATRLEEELVHRAVV